MAKDLNQIITKDEARQIVLHAIGREATDKELEESEVEFINHYKCSTDPEDKLMAQRLVIPLYEHKREFPTMKIVICPNGLVQYKNWSGCQFSMHNPMEIYKIILSHEEEIKKLWKSI